MTAVKVRYTTEDLLTISAFEKLTRTEVVDYLDFGDVAYFVIKGRISNVIGKKGEKIRRIENLLGKRVKVFRHADDLETFLRNLMLVDVKSTKILKNDGKIIVKVEVNPKDRPIIIGREGKNIKAIKEFLKRQFDVDDVKLK